MKRGFTLLELIIVIIILGVLATLGLAQYGSLVEKSRGAEARGILGDIRSFAAAYRMEKSSISGVTASQLNLGTSAGMIPTTCTGQTTHYFAYTYSESNPSITITATRCTAGGKPPTGEGDKVVLTSNLSTGSDVWGPTGPY